MKNPFKTPGFVIEQNGLGEYRVCEWRAIGDWWPIAEGINSMFDAKDILYKAKLAKEKAAAAGNWTTVHSE